MPPARLDIRLERSHLDNGLELVVLPHHDAPLISGLIAVRAGASVQDESQRGYAHLLEHMVWRGVGMVANTKQYSDRLAAVGADTNGATRTDAVQFVLSVQPEGLDEALGLMATAIQQPALGDAELEIEKQVVLSELDLDEAKPDYLASRALLQELFGDSFSRSFPFDSRSAIEAADSDKLREFHDTYYVPGNTLLVLSGDITLAQGRELARRHFGSWQSAADPLIDHPVPVAPQLEANLVATLAAPISNSWIRVAYRCPGFHEDSAQALAGTLLASMTTYFWDNSLRELEQELHGATSASMSYAPGRLASYVSLNLTLAAGDEDRVLEKLRDALEHIGTLSDAEFAEAQDRAWRSFAYDTDGPVQVLDVATSWALDDVGGYARIADDIYEVDKTALSRFARRYMQSHPHAVILVSSAENLSGLTADTIGGYL
jgi:predicted Zn-dependent peptidase